MLSRRVHRLETRNRKPLAYGGTSPKTRDLSRSIQLYGGSALCPRTLRYPTGESVTDLENLRLRGSALTNLPLEK
jgi:hypothetical protein